MSLSHKRCLRSNHRMHIQHNFSFLRAILLEDEARKYNNLETLFDLQKSGYNQLKDCRNELRSLKYQWDMIQLIHFQFNAWKLTLWDKIDTDSLLAQIKKLKKKQVNPVYPTNKEIKDWVSSQHSASELKTWGRFCL